MGKIALISAAYALYWVLFSTANAANFSFSGLFSADDDVRLFSFSIADSSTVTLRTYGYGGGAQADGNVVPAGGFDPALTLFDSAGLMIDFDDDGAASLDTVDPETGLALDALLELGLGAGVYTLALTQIPNVANGRVLTDGFLFTGYPDITSTYNGNPACSNGQFCAEFSAIGDNDPLINRTGAWAIDILGVTSASVVPIPAAVWLFGSGLLGLTVLARRQKV